MARPKRQHLKRRKDGRYCCTFHGVQFMGATEEEALAKREQYKQKKRVSTRKTLGEYSMYWLPVHKAGVKATTYNSYVSILSNVLQPISGIYLEDLTTDNVSDALSKLTGKSASYIHKARILLTAILDSAADAGLMDGNPARAKSVKPPKGSRGTHRAITEEERQAILTTPHRMQLAALVMLYCGLRRGEVLGLRADDFSGDTVQVSRAVYYVSNQPKLSATKTAHGIRTVPVPDFILPMLPETGYILPGKEDQPMTETAFTRGWESYVKALGHNIRPHDLRHSYCTWLRDSGVDIHQAIIWMGHADEKLILRIYDHPGSERETEAKNRLKSALSMQNHMQAEEDQPENK